MSWTKRVRHPKEIVKKGDSVDVVILDINKEKRRISLGIKQLIENPWDDLAERYADGTECKGKVVRMLDHGAIVEIEDQVEGFVPLQHLGIVGIEKPQEHFTLEEELPVVVIKIQPDSRKIVLSATEYFSAHTDDLEAFLEAHPKRELSEEELESIAREQDEDLDRELAAEDN
jgi:small subunit ribosomal protein S1